MQNVESSSGTSTQANVVDPKFFNMVAQFSHFFAGATVYLTIGVLFSFRIAVFMLPVGVGLAAWKEFWYDMHKENPATAGSSIEDFAFYMAGIIYAMAILVFK